MLLQQERQMRQRLARPPFSRQRFSHLLKELREPTAVFGQEEQAPLALPCCGFPQNSMS
jgi:hypothetical protein